MGVERRAPDSARQQGTGLEGFLEEVIHVLILKNKPVLSRSLLRLSCQIMECGQSRTNDGGQI